MTLLLSLPVQDDTQMRNTGQEQPVPFQEWLESCLKNPVKDALRQHTEEKASGLYRGLYIFTTRKSSDSTLSSAPAESVRYCMLAEGRLYWSYHKRDPKISQTCPSPRSRFSLLWEAAGTEGLRTVGSGCRPCGVGPAISVTLAS